jgi:hypothetical protein
MLTPETTSTSTYDELGQIQAKPESKYGIHLLLDDGEHQWPIAVWEQHVRYARDLVGEWGYVVELIRLDDLDPAKWQVFMDLCANLHLTPIIRLATTYDRTNRWWTAPPKDADGIRYTEVARRYRDFVASLVWPTTLKYIIVGNEPNRGDEWSNRPNGAEYAQFLTDVSDALRSLDPENTKILNAGLDQYCPHTNGQVFIDGYRYIDAETFMDQMHAYKPDIFNYIQVWASHAYPLGPFTLDPSKQTFQIDYLNGAINPDHVDPPEGIYNRGINAYRWELYKLSTYDDPGVCDLPVMITETGWRHRSAQHSQAADSGGAYPDDHLVAQYFDLAFHGNADRYSDLPSTGWIPWLDDPQVIAIIPFALGGVPSKWGHTNWVVLDATGRIIDVYPQYRIVASSRKNGI